MKFKIQIDKSILSEIDVCSNLLSS